MIKRVGWLLLLAGFSVSGIELAPAPQWNQPPVPNNSSVIALKIVTVNALNRAAVVDLYHNFFLLLDQVPAQWSGSLASCIPGTTSSAFRDAVIDRVNIYRVLAGLPGNLVQYGTDETAASQAAALIMAAQESLSHDPPADWPCYSPAGDEGAGKSNLALGVHGVSAIDLYMDDPGASNTYVGHRRWLLYPPQQAMASGDITAAPASNALRVIGTFGSRPATPMGTAWPPRGFIPYQVLPKRSNRWSYSFPGANFRTAVVTMMQNGTTIPVTLEAIPDFDNSAGISVGDPTLVWRPQGIPYTQPAGDTRYDITISQITGNGVPSTVSYAVTVIDPDAPPSFLFKDGFE